MSEQNNQKQLKTNKRRDNLSLFIGATIYITAMLCCAALVYLINEQITKGFIALVLLGGIVKAIDSLKESGAKNALANYSIVIIKIAAFISLIYYLFIK